MTTNDFDPTTNRIPFGLLSKDEQTALIHWPHGFEYWNTFGAYWANCDAFDFKHTRIYRGLPKPPVVTSVWWNIDSNGSRKYCYFSRKNADANANSGRIAVLRIDTCNGVSTADLEGV